MYLPRHLASGTGWLFRCPHRGAFNAKLDACSSLAGGLISKLYSYLHGVCSGRMGRALFLACGAGADQGRQQGKMQGVVGGDNPTIPSLADFYLSSLPGQVFSQFQILPIWLLYICDVLPNWIMGPVF